VRRGRWVGHPTPSACSGEAEIVLRGDELWLRVVQLKCAAASAGDTLFMYTSARARPVAIADLDSEGSRVPIPGTAQGGVEDRMPSTIMVPLQDIRPSPEAPPVHWRDIASLFICRPGLQLVLQGGDVPTTVFGVCALRLVPAKETAASRAAEGGAAGAGRSAPEETDASALPAAAGSDLVDKTWTDLGDMAKAALSQMGKEWQTASLTFTEFKVVLGFLRVSFSEARAWLWYQTADVSGNGAVEWDELQFIARVVQLLRAPTRILPRDVYFMFDGSKRTARNRFRLGRVDVIAFHEICSAYGLRVSLSQAEKKFDSLDLAGKLSIGYSRFFDGFCELMDPRLELTRRGINPARLPAGLPRDARAAARATIAAEEAEMVREIKVAVAAAADDRKRERRTRERAAKGAWVRRQQELRSAKRAMALRERSAKLERSAVAKERVAREREEAELRRGVERQKKRTERQARQAQEEDKEAARKAEETSMAQQGLDRVVLARRGLSFLPSALWLEPAAAAMLPGLLLLDVSQNALEALPGPALLSRLDRLRKLDASGNRLSELPEAIGSLARLQILSVSGNRLRSLPRAVRRLGALRVLDVSGNQLEELPPGIADLEGLRALHLHDNRLHALPERLGERSALLVRLTLRSNRLATLPSGIGGLTALPELDVSWNRLVRLPEALGGMQSLRRLDASHNRLVELPASVGRCAALERLTAGNNSLASLPPSLCSLTRLVALEVPDNRIGSLPADIGACSSLLELDARNNRLGSVPPSVGRLIELQIADLSGNRLMMLPPDVAGCRAIRHLSLANNRLGAEGVDPVPASFASLAALVFLDMSSNHISTVGPAIGFHTKLAHLNLSSNRLPAIPASVLRVRTLVELSLAGNRVADVPDELCAALPRLRTLDLSCNVVRRLPQAIGAMTALRNLNLYNNRLDTLPLTLAGALSRLETLDVARNPLRELPRKVPGAPVAGAAALSTRYRAPRARGLSFLGELHRTVGVQRARERELEADADRDGLDDNRHGMAAEDARAAVWASSGLHTHLLRWRSAAGRKVVTAGDAAVAALDSGPFDRATGSIAAWFSGAAMLGAEGQSAPASPAAGESLGRLPRLPRRPQTSGSGSRSPARAGSSAAVTPVKAPQSPLRGTTEPGGRPSTASAALRSPPHPLLVTLDLLRPEPQARAEAVASAARRRGSSTADDGTEAVRHVHIPAPPSGAGLFRFGTGVTRKVHLGAPGRPLDADEEAQRASRAVDGLAPLDVEAGDDEVGGGGARCDGKRGGGGGGGGEAAAAASRHQGERHVEREGYGSPGDEAFERLRRERKGRAARSTEADSSAARHLAGSDATWLPSARVGRLAAPAAVSARALAVAQARAADHNRPVDPSANFLGAAVFSRGYTNADVAEYLSLQARFHAHATEEWMRGAVAYMSREAGLDDFRARVRRRAGASYDPALRPLVDRFFSHACASGVPPVHSSLTPSAMGNVRRLREAGAAAVQRGRDEVAAAIRSRAQERDSKYAIDPAELGHRILRREAEAKANARADRAAGTARARRAAAKARARIDANAVALYRVKRTTEVADARGLQREVASRVKVREREAARRQMLEAAAAAAAEQ